MGAGGTDAAPSAAASSPLGLSPVPPPATLGATENRLILVEKPTDSTAISIGFALDVKPGDPDFPPLAFAASWFGEHRQICGWLQKRMRILRGLNYGNYAYTEFFRQGRWSVYPAAGFPRSRQYFSIWIRPVEPENGPFALRQAVHELRKLLKEGIPAGELERAREYVVGLSRLKEQMLDRRLGMAFDDRFYGVDRYADALRASWSGLRIEEVNAAIRRRWRGDGLTMVMVVRDAEAARRALLSAEPAKITYVSPMPQDVTDEDRVIGTTDLGLTPDRITIVKAEELFEQ